MENLGKSAGHEEGTPALNERGPSEPYTSKKHLSTPPQGGPIKKAILRGPVPAACPQEGLSSSASQSPSHLGLAQELKPPPNHKNQKRARDTAPLVVRSV